MLQTKTQTSVYPSSMPLHDPASRCLLDCADLQRLYDFAGHYHVPVRHALLAAVQVLLLRHGELGPSAIEIDLSASFASAFPRSAADIFPFYGSIDSTQSFIQAVNAAAVTEAVTIGVNNPPRIFLPDIIPYRLRVTIPSQASEPRTYILSMNAEEGLVVSADDFRPLDLSALAVFRRLRPLIEGGIVAPNTPVGSLQLLTAAERHEILVAWNDTSSPVPANTYAHYLVAAQAARTPNAIAIAGCEERSLTYGELDLSVNHLAERLRWQDVGAGSIVAISLENSADLVIAILATLKAGAAYLLLEPEATREYCSYVFADAAPSVLIAGRSFLDQQNHRVRNEIAVETGELVIFADDADISIAAAESSVIVPDSIACISYVSVPGGLPAGVSISHQALVNTLMAAGDYAELSGGDVQLSVGGAWPILDLLLPLAFGARIVPVPRRLAVDGPGLRDALEHSGATIFHASPSIWQRLVVAGWQGTTGLRMFCSTGFSSSLSVTLARELLLRGAALWNMFGMPETASLCTIHRVDGDSDDPVPIGTPVANIRCYVLDGMLKPVPAGMTGDLYITGAGIARDYLNRPALTEARFPADPFSRQAGSRLFRTGATARYRADGHIECLSAKSTNSLPAAFPDGELQSPSVPALITLRGSGRQTPLFFLSDLGVLSAEAFAELPVILGDDRPVYALDLPAGRNDTAAGIGALAEYAIQQIRLTQPVGPYHLAGYCAGGVIAYEVARILREAGQEVAIVVLFDTFGPDYPHVRLQRRSLREHVSHLIECAWELLHEKACEKTAYLPSDAGKAYCYPSYAGPIALFRATVTPAGEGFADIQNGWGATVQARIELHPVPCARANLFHPAQVQRWGSELRDLLDRVDAATA
ncbi:MAG TPA: AMP-binding protein [Tepidisphaeraceae bacterium]|jgi:non-ribosomal peptide synthetase component F|nr:AMP-binding protein [Tepidisphaeraceae bacterium]